VVDAVDQHLEEALDRITAAIRVAQHAGRATDTAERTQILGTLQSAVQRLEGAVARVDAIDTTPANGETAEPLPLDELTRATAQAEKAIAGVEAALGSGEEPPERRRGRARTGQGPAAGGSHHLRRPLRHLVRWHVLDVCRDVPLMAERVLELSGPIAVVLVLDRPQLLRARLQSALEGAVDVLDVDQHRHRGAPDGLRPADVH